MRAAVLLALLPPACAVPRGETGPMAPGGPAAAAKPTEVLVLGTIHGGHLESERWGLDQLRDTIRRIRPDVVCCEIPPDRWPRVERDWRERRVVEDERVLRFPEYTDVLLPLRDELGFAVEPCAAWTQAMADERRARIQELETDPLHAAAFAEYEREVAAIEARQAAEPLDEDDPRTIHSEAYDRRVKEQLGPYDRWMNDFIGAGGWTNVNRAHWALIEDALARHAGERVLITFGAGHKHWLLERLRERADVRLVDVARYLPPPEPSPASSAARPAAAPAASPESGETRTMDELCRREVEELHRFFQDWFGGEIEGTEQVLARFAGVLDADFRIVWPDGSASDRAATLERVAAAHGAHWKRDPPFRIAITGYRGRALSEQLHLVTYEEWQQLDEQAEGRLSTAVFQRDPAAPNRVRWLHVHETRLPSPGVGADGDGSGD